MNRPTDPTPAPRRGAPLGADEGDAGTLGAGELCALAGAIPIGAPAARGDVTTDPDVRGVTE